MKLGSRKNLRFISLCLVTCLLDTTHADDAAIDAEVQTTNRAFRTFFVTRSLGHERLLPYLKAARPEIVQVGNYGAMFHGYADNPKSKKSPMMLPVSGERAALAFQKTLNDKVHDLGLSVVGHFRLTKVMADWQEQSGFVEYYNNRWPEDLLGPKPHPELIELLQRDSNGVPIQLSRYDNAQLALCMSSPHARKMLKQMLKCAIDHGVDGVITTYNYRQECVCSYCQSAFKTWLSERVSPEELRSDIGIDNLDEHEFESIPTRIPGYPEPKESTELEWLAIRWGAEHFKQKFDEIFLDYGRSLRRNLLVAQWNHLSHVSIREERMFLPQQQWGRGEDYFWYSGGASFVGKNLNLKEGKAGDAWLSCLYLRELSGGKPFVMGKYDGIRLAASMAEGYATGGSGMGRYMRFENDTGYEVLTRYTNFMHEHRELYENAEPFADVALVLPRQSVWNRRSDALGAFREMGQALVERQLLLDVLADENLSFDRLSKYPAVILAGAASLSERQLAALRDFADKGGLILQHGEAATMDETGRTRSDAQEFTAVSVIGDATEEAAESIESHLQKHGASAIDAPWTLRAAAYSQANRVLLHVVNYDRDEAMNKRLKGPELERPIAVENVSVALRLPAGREVESIMLHTPDERQQHSLVWQQRDNQAVFNVPRVLVYAVIEVILKVA